MQLGVIFNPFKLVVIVVLAIVVVFFSLVVAFDGRILRHK